ncbi:MAG: ATP synthase F0 subunit C [bacterium]
MLKRLLSTTASTILLMLVSIPAFAEGAPAQAAGDVSVKAWLAIASGIGIAIAAFGGALGQGRSISSALDGIARNPGASGKIVTPMIIGLALIESLVIYAFVIAFLLQGKI